MAYSYKFHPLAQKEYVSSIKWYIDKSIKAAANFVLAVDKGLASICNAHKQNPNKYKHYFEYNLYRYPFTLV